MNYPEELRERYNEAMYDERDIIEKFLKDQYDLRYGHQRDTWHFEPAVKMMMTDGEHVSLTDIKLDKNVFVMFSVIDSKSKRKEYECGYFAYGELSKVIEAMPDADEIVKENAIDDIATELELSGNIVWTTGQKHIIGDGFDVLMVTGKGYDAKVVLRKCNVNSEPIMLKNLSTMELKQLRDHINLCNLHKDNDYKKLVKFLSEQPNLRFEPANCGDVEFTIHGTDVKVDVLSASLDSVGALQLCCNDVNENIYFGEKAIRPEYLVDLVGYIEDHCRCDIMDTYNAHNPELVRKINDAWKSGKYNQEFSYIVYSIANRDYTECKEKFGCEMSSFLSAIIDDCDHNCIHNVLENVCDDQDLETILSFIRYEE